MSKTGNEGVSPRVTRGNCVEMISYSFFKAEGICKFAGFEEARPRKQAQKHQDPENEDLARTTATHIKVPGICRVVWRPLM